MTISRVCCAPERSRSDSLDAHSYGEDRSCYAENAIFCQKLCKRRDLRVLHKRASISASLRDGFDLYSAPVDWGLPFRELLHNANELGPIIVKESAHGGCGRFCPTRGAPAVLAMDVANSACRRRRSRGLCVVCRHAY